VWDEGIRCEINLEDFIHAVKKELADMPEFREALKQELGSVATVFRKKTLGERLDQAFSKSKHAFERELDSAIGRVIKAIKAESVKAI